MNEPMTTQAARLRQLHSLITAALKATLDKAIEAGGILRDVKAALPHGEFGKWVEEYAGFNIRTAQRYMKIFDNRNQLKSDSVSYLNDAYKLLTAPKKNDDFYIPPTGCGLFIIKPTDKIDFALVTPHKLSGYYFRTWLEDHGTEGRAIVGDRRGVSADWLSRSFDKLFSQRSDQVSILKPGHEWAGPWDYNQLLFDSHYEYMEKGLGIRQKMII